MMSKNKISDITLRICIILTITVCSSTLHAADKNGNFAIKGAGSISCAKYGEIKEERTRDYYVFVGWLEGYLTAVNQYREETYDLAPWQSPELLMIALSKHCSKNPTKGFITAVNDMIRALDRGKLQEMSDIVAMISDGKQLYAYKAIIKMAQERLIKQKFFSGEIDGEYTPLLRESIKKYQKERGIAASGLPDQTTLLQLFR